MHEEIQINSLFLKKHGYLPNLKNPQTLSEKIQWLKLNANLERFADYTDKYNVRQFITEEIGEQYLPPMIGVYDHVDDIDYGSLPNSFVIKGTHGSGWYSIVKDKSNINWEEESTKWQKWINTNYYNLSGESQYKPLKGRLIIEEMLNDPSGDLKDYRFYCFFGEPKLIIVDGEKYRMPRKYRKRDVYDTNWVRLPYVFPDRLIYPHPLPKPNRLSEMIEIARHLSKKFGFVRVDLYYTNDRIYFGEITLTPSNGFRRYPDDLDKQLGDELNLSIYP